MKKLLLVPYFTRTRYARIGEMFIVLKVCVGTYFTAADEMGITSADIVNERFGVSESI